MCPDDELGQGFAEENALTADCGRPQSADVAILRSELNRRRLSERQVIPPVAEDVNRSERLDE
jgi:hypothetical protein